ncbi:cu/Zn superoxide dismutase [Magnaporthiopsis poae ATCC 64411]|uniref:superoxide dismutase n=1 Tax=Magnaporthiopsis poae (strain ATCC 64411 / 73-15) TaxID=644358 RepID=A0A0C4DWV6_MAGP6|nr:cu/Zn superoxide dismutase [Magnaporthiopsis poae ATCC 64411]
MKKQFGSGALTAWAILPLGSLAVPCGAAPDPTSITGKLGDAPVITNNPPAVAVAQFIATEGKPFHGSVVAVSSPDGTGVFFQVNFRNLPTDGVCGPYEYHLHERALPPDGNCSAAGGHLDPFQRGQEIPCDINRPQSCQVGDLSGKHGKVAAPNLEFKRYRELYTSLTPDTTAFFANRSVVVHFPNGTRFACANFTSRDFLLDAKGVDGPRFEGLGPGMFGGPAGDLPGVGFGRGLGPWAGPGSGLLPPDGRPWFKRALSLLRM